MFTGIITDIGIVAAREGDSFSLRSSYPADGIAIGASICCDGVCLTVTNVTEEGDGCLFHVDTSNETRAKTTLESWQRDRKVNLERPVRAGDELGGHVVSGHVDSVAKIVDIKNDGDCRRFSFEAPEHLAPFIAPKGSVALDGTSLTVNEVSANRFGVNIIPHTMLATTWNFKVVGEMVNLEVDLFARYVARLMEYRQ